MKIPILLGTTRKDNYSRKVAAYLQKLISQNNEVESDIMDLGETDFPILIERPTAENPISSQLQEWIQKLKDADGLIIVAPEYKNSYPGSLKNFIDLLPAGLFRYMPIGISTVSSGAYAGYSCLQQLRLLVLAMAGIVVPDRFMVGGIQAAFDDKNDLMDEKLNKTANKFVSEIIKYAEVFKEIEKQ